jgi:Fe-S-cluster containining protein
MREHLSKPLILADGVVFTCQNSGACCRNDWLIGVDDTSYQRLRHTDWARVDPALPPGEKFATLPHPLASGETRTFARTAGGACVFLDRDTRCSIHRHLGARAKPQVCREFPYTFIETPDGVSVGLSFACTAVRGRHGMTLPEQRSEVVEVLEGSARVTRVPDPIGLYSGLDIAWTDYKPIETALLEILTPADRPFERSLIAGSLLVNLCVGLRQVEINGPAGAPRQTLASGLAELERERYRRLFDIAAGVRPPRRRSLAYLAPLHAWLRLQRQPISRFRLVLALYRDYVRFRRVRGVVADLVTGDGALDLASVARVTVPADRETDAFLGEYWRHVVFRKTLTPLHGVFRGYHTLLALHAFTKWAARVIAFRAGRRAATLADVQDAVRFVEQRFVLHAQFANVFSVSPVFTILADRLLGQPSFVPAATLEPSG